MSEIPLYAASEQEVRISLLEMTLPELEEWLRSMGQPAYRARQIWEWIYKSHVADFADMRNLPATLRTQLAESATIMPLSVATQVVSQAHDTLKVLFRLADGQMIEAVLMLYDDRRTLCISSQVGSAMGCTFSATALGGLARNLTSGEIIAQVLYFAHYLATPDAEPLTDVERPAAVSNIVLMGMGEPLHNYANVWTALHRLTDGEAFGLGARHITLSTVGLVPGIDRMANEDLQIGLAVSLHAPNDTLRTSLVPINRGYSINELFDAVRRYIDQTHRRVTFEYALMRGINDTPELAQQLAGKLRGMICHVNLIPLNPIPDSPYQPSTSYDAEQFAEILRAAGISTTIRLRRGIEINAGCGQLRTAQRNQKST